MPKEIPKAGNYKLMSGFISTPRDLTCGYEPMTAQHPLGLQLKNQSRWRSNCIFQRMAWVWFLKSQGWDLPGSLCEIMSLGICWDGEKGQPSWLFSVMAVWPRVALVPSGELWRMLVPDTQGQWAYSMKKYRKCLAQLMASPKPSAQDTHTCSLMGLGGLWLPKGKCSPTPPCCALN